ncbi:hypothetical protein Mlaev_02443 [Microbacterium laevaniformans]|uniref:Lipoprotein n=1 Tax=Microbacterium laevaniformans TaxID=36807 RepID=A0A150HAP1_9MICO|nr:hypothetical protein [Microbacterium laevaniformans]KXZ58740.1 hypothetical protein Mlaev_02443 [Microbacterium laevaniformans]
MLTKRPASLIAAAVAIAGALTLAGCTGTQPPVSSPTVSTSETPTPTPTSFEPPADEAEAIAAAEATITRLLTIQAEVDQAGGTDTAAYDAVATGKALQLYVANSTRIAEGPLLNEDGESIDGQSTVEGAITFEPLSAYGQEWQDVPNGLVIVPGCLDGSGLKITTADGKPAMQNPNPRNQVEFHVVYDVDQKSWLVNDRISLGETC